MLLRNQFLHYQKEPPPRKKNPLMDKLINANRILETEPVEIRPSNDNGFPGGMIRLKNIPALIVPDLHGRVDFLPSLLFSEINGGKIIDSLDRGEVQIICLGDAMQRGKKSC